jgi:salicylate hydroxylase
LKWGLGSYLQGKAIELEAINMRRWQNGEVIGLTQLIPNFRAIFDAPFYVVHRANLQLAMYKLALDLGVEVKLNSGVKGYKNTTATIILDDGSEHHGDLVVAADGQCTWSVPRSFELMMPGLKSEARKMVLGGEDQPPQEAGFAAYRAMVNTDRMKSDPELSWLVDNPCQNLWYTSTSPLLFLD